MFVDEAVITCVAGHGGNGCQSFDRSRPGRHRPTGGDGGEGGSVIVEARSNIQTLLDFQFQRYFSAEGGGHGSSNQKNGRRGGDCVIGVPVGTQVIDRASGELLRDLDAAGAHVRVCQGGTGGRGNDKRNQAERGRPGEKREVLLKLKLMADIGLVGFPNAGKSTFLSRVSNARSKAAAYPFTTKNPVLGVVKFDDEKTGVVADIPGIVGGAHRGRGMGLEFLKHVERTRVLVHLVDLAAVDGRDPVSDYEALVAELAAYSKALAQKVQLVAANKMDLPQARENLGRFRERIREQVFPISAATGEGVPELLDALGRLI